MTTPGGHDSRGSTRVGGSTSPTGTTTGPTGTTTGPTSTTTGPTGTTTGADTTARMTDQSTVRPAGERAAVTAHKTSAAAAFALVFGLSALFCALTGILSPFAVLFGLIGIVLGVVGMKKAKLPGVTGRGVAIGGLVTAVLGLLLGAAVIAGAAALVNDDAQLDRLENRIEQLRQDAPSAEEIREEIPGQ
jgi:hypothetical protein